MRFGYLTVSTSMDSIEVDDIGNVYLQSSNDDGATWYLRIETKLGWCSSLEFGPVQIDPDSPIYSFSLQSNKFEFNEKRLYKIIDTFINQPKRNITCVNVISREDFEYKLGEIKDGIW